MKGLKAFSDKTKSAQEAVNGQNIWIPLYYNPDNDAVYSTAGKGRQLVTHFINAVDPKDITEVVNKWKWA